MLSMIKDFLPEPFDWCEIPAGKVTLEEGGYIPEGGQVFEVSAFYMAKYHITNAQFRLFVEGDGYSNPNYWTKIGWQYCQRDNWTRTKPRYWDDSRWNGSNHPIVGISWYEALAYCNWLNSRVTEIDGLTFQITLPTEQQWQHAVQGDKEETYTRLVNQFSKEKTYAYPSGESPYGVKDMNSNKWNWCLTTWDDGAISATPDVRHVLRGGRHISAFPVHANQHHARPPIVGRHHTSFRICAIPIPS